MCINCTIFSEEQRELINLYCSDNLLKLKAICIPLIRQKNVAQMEEDDLISNAMWVLLETVSTYNSEINPNFGAVLTTNIKCSYLDWTRDRMRDKRVNYARDRVGNIIYEKYKDGGGEIKKRKVIIKPLSLDAEIEDGIETSEVIASKMNLEDLFIEEEIHKEVQEYLNGLSPLQRKVILMLSNKYTEKEICEILHIDDRQFKNICTRLKSAEKIKPLLKLL